MFSHPRSTNLARDTIRVLRRSELKDQMPLVDPRNSSCERAGINNEPHSFPRGLYGRVGRRVMQAKVIDNDVHEPTLFRSARRFEKGSDPSGSDP